MNNTYPYPYSAAEARKRNELSLWRESYKANIACRNAIEDAIRQNFDGMNLQTDCLKAVLDEYGGLAGVVSLEDVLEEILGSEIMDESDNVADLRALARDRRKALTLKGTQDKPAA